MLWTDQASEESRSFRGSLSRFHEEDGQGDLQSLTAVRARGTQDVGIFPPESPALNISISTKAASLANAHYAPKTQFIIVFIVISTTSYLHIPHHSQLMEPGALPGLSPITLTRHSEEQRKPTGHSSEDTMCPTYFTNLALYCDCSRNLQGSRDCSVSPILPGSTTHLAQPEGSLHLTTSPPRPVSTLCNLHGTPGTHSSPVAASATASFAQLPRRGKQQRVCEGAAGRARLGGQQPTAVPDAKENLGPQAAGPERAPPAKSALLPARRVGDRQTQNLSFPTPGAGQAGSRARGARRPRPLSRAPGAQSRERGRGVLREGPWAGAAEREPPRERICTRTRTRGPGIPRGPWAAGRLRGEEGVRAARPARPTAPEEGSVWSGRWSREGSGSQETREGSRAEGCCAPGAWRTGGAEPARRVQSGRVRGLRVRRLGARRGARRAAGPGVCPRGVWGRARAMQAPPSSPRGRACARCPEGPNTPRAGRPGVTAGPASDTVSPRSSSCVSASRARPPHPTPSPASCSSATFPVTVQRGGRPADSLDTGKPAGNSSGTCTKSAGLSREASPSPKNTTANSGDSSCGKQQHAGKNSPCPCPYMPF
ncbi:PREDICTED: translation initiation factor IF-2-like [Chinchilla lanigera]|uniref:translation initiation factor IF-2-like n=1 Tax=Chinchilla lanigera TaxID=34839 RepID=UPI000697276F|nr:PREDICTED: translation initiation factor IF-2-like [Chinchilla lanigera]